MNRMLIFLWAFPGTNEEVFGHYTLVGESSVQEEAHHNLRRNYRILVLH